MTAEDRLELYLETLRTLSRTSHGGSFSAFQAAYAAGDARGITIGAEQQELNAQAIAAHTTKLEWLERNGYLQSRRQRWHSTYEAKPEDNLEIYWLTAKGEGR